MSEQEAYNHSRCQDTT